MPTLFRFLAEFLEKIESTKSRLQIIALASEFLKTLETG